ncbi:metalloreductase transmembrane component [Lasallia pustulata]|uniref:ferric-chelate reductase (NADPH) n=1 Tax=Lasallia pustulata TaxID=136370 RepID=A0A1W5CR79_9LECA|nr:metalloreductase transmembrane component [Lasallia pustulata]
MPSIRALLDEATLSTSVASLTKRIKIPINANSPPGLIAASKQDPWSKSGKYALGWVYFSVLLLIITILIRLYHLWTDKIRRALHKEEAEKTPKILSPDSDYEMDNLPTGHSTRKFFPGSGAVPKVEAPKEESTVSSIVPLNIAFALVRWVFYRPMPVVRYKKREIVFPSLGAVVIVSMALAFVTMYCFIPQPLYYQSIRFGSPPLAIRAGMLAVAMMPWIVALSMKANMVAMLTGIGHERLNVLHRWGGYICLFLSLVHTIPFYITPVWDHGAQAVFKSYFPGKYYVYGTGVAALVPLIFLCVHSLPILRRKMYELFVALHVPVAIVYLGMLFWHCHNYLTSWNYLFATVAIWVISYCIRLFYLNWTNPRRMSWLIGEEAAITVLPENAVKVTIPTQVKWRPGQYVYLRMPGISVFENHPFTIASLCSEDFRSDYGEEYRDMTLVFRPFGGFTRKVLNAAMEKGPYKTYRAFIDGPYGGMQRDLAAFDTVVLFAGGSGITALVSQLLDLIKKMRDGKAVTKSVHVIWALKRPETLEWFKEELKICRDYAPPDTVHCQFFITAAKRHRPGEPGSASQPNTPSRPVSDLLHSKINDTFQGIASKRSSALIRDEAGGDAEKERELRRENEDAITGLPQPYFPPSPPKALTHPRPPGGRPKPAFKLDIPAPDDPRLANADAGGRPFDFGFPSTPTMLQKNLMRFAFLPSVGGAQTKKAGWRTEYGRPDVPYMLKGLSKGFGRRTCVFVCGPPGMRMDVAGAVAGLQRRVWENGLGGGVEEVFLHTENYAI